MSEVISSTENIDYVDKRVQEFLNKIQKKSPKPNYKFDKKQSFYFKNEFKCKKYIDRAQLLIKLIDEYKSENIELAKDIFFKIKYMKYMVESVRTEQLKV